MSIGTWHEYPLLGERQFAAVLPDGLRVHLVPKRGFTKRHAILTAGFGSVEAAFQVQGEGLREVPAGVAHFLEHKLFEEPWGDAFSRFAEYGAQANAFTGHSRTSYLFSTQEEVEESLKLLLDFVQHPYFTPHGVAKEMDIIEQEIKMYDDMPQWMGYRHLLESLYHRHPVRLDIAGTVASIRQIDIPVLQACHRAFYHPSNMVLCMVGDFDAEALMALIVAEQARRGTPPVPPVQRRLPDESPSVAAGRHETHLAVSRTTLMVGWKEAVLPLPEHLLRRELLMALALDLLFGKSSPLHQELMDAGLIDEQMTYDYDNGPGFAHVTLAGETDTPDLVMERIDQTLTQVQREGLDPVAFERIRRKQLGDFLGELNSPENVASQLTDLALRGDDYFSVPGIIDGITKANVEELIAQVFQPGQRAISIVRPKLAAPV